jgi:hypothetical protein
LDRPHPQSKPTEQKKSRNCRDREVIAEEQILDPNCSGEDHQVNDGEGRLP